MSREQPTFQPITPSRTREGPSRPRSAFSRNSHSLQRVPTAKSFDDHAVYNDQAPHQHEAVAETRQEAEQSHDSDSDKQSVDDRDLEKGPTDSSATTPAADLGSPPPIPPASAGEKEEPPPDPFIVSWDGPEDPANPKNWTLRHKWAATAIVSCFTLMSPMSSSMVAPALVDIAPQLHITNETEAALTISIFVLAYAVGPLFLGPLSEVFGRVIILQTSNLWYAIFNLACGFAQTAPQLLVFRFFAGLGGSAPMAIGGGVIGDCFAAEQRGRAVSMYSLAPLLGPAIGPIIGGAVSGRTTWRWIFWATTIFDIAVQIFGLFFLQETYAPTILARKAKKLRRETGNPAYQTPFERQDRSFATIIGGAMIRPFRLLGTQPIIQAIAVYMAFIYGLMYLMLTSFPALWTGAYGETTFVGSLNYISLGVGFFLGAQIGAPINDKVYVRLTRVYGVGKPEYRVPTMIVGSLLIPVGLLMYGWSAQARTHWIVPNIGAAIFCAGAIACFQAMQTYIVDSYTRYAASGIAAAVVMRSLCGFGFPLFAQQMFNKLGYGWGNTVLALIAVVLGIPAPVLFWKYGEALRARSRYAAG